MNKTRSLKVHIATAAAAVAIMTIPVLADNKIFKDETTTLSEDSVYDVVQFNNATVNLGTYNLRAYKFTREGEDDSYVTFGGGALRLRTITYPQIFEKSGAGVLHLVGSSAGDIKINTYWDSTSPRALFKTWLTTASDIPRLVTEGNCNVVFGNETPSHTAMTIHFQCFCEELGDNPYGGTFIGWNHTGDLIFNGAKQTIVIGNDNILPAGAQTGGVVVDNASTTLDFNGKTEAVNALEVRHGVVTNTAATAATIVLGTNDANTNISDIVKADLKGDFNYEKAGSGTLTIDKGNYGTLTVSDGAVAFTATPGTAITVDSLVVNSATMGTLVVDGVALTIGTASGSALGGVAVVTRNGGTFSCNTWGADAAATLREPALAATDALVKLGGGTLTVASTNSLPAKLDVRAGTVRFRTPYLTGGSKMLLKYTFKKTSGINQKLCFAEIRIRGWNNVGAWTDNAIAAAYDADPTKPLLERYPVRSTMQEVIDNYGVWVNGEYIESSTGNERALPYAPYCLFDNGNGNNNRRIYNPTNTVPSQDNSATWQTVAFRVFWWQSVVKLCGYNFTKGWYQQNTGLPVSWTVEASTNGTDWVIVDERVNVTPPAVASWEHDKWYTDGTDFEHAYKDNATTSRDFSMIGLGAECGVGSAASVRVDAGATIDLEGLPDSERTISALEIDMAVGGGRITTFAPAANGVLDIVNFSGTLGESTDLGLTFDSIVDAANLNTWTVCVNGVAKPKRVAARDGKLVVLADATLITFR